MSDENDGFPDRVFHDPMRLAILSTLLENPDDTSFNSLKAACGFTDGNLQSHLRVLREARVVALKKEICNDRVRTRVTMTDDGRLRLLGYLETLESVLRRAATAAGVAKSRTSSILSPSGLKVARGGA